jgi:hypothetical protein
VGCLCWWSLGCGVTLRHTTINYEICAVNKATLVTSKEENRLSLLNGLSETSSRKVNLAAVSLGLVVAEPVLQKWGAIFISIIDVGIALKKLTSRVLGRAH